MRQIEIVEWGIDKYLSKTNRYFSELLASIIKLDNASFNLIKQGDVYLALSKSEKLTIKKYRESNYLHIYIFNNKKQTERKIEEKIYKYLLYKQELIYNLAKKIDILSLLDFNTLLKMAVYFNLTKKERFIIKQYIKYGYKPEFYYYFNLNSHEILERFSRKI